MKYKAFLFDLNGTMIDDMSYHVSAWYRILNGFGAGFSVERVKQECYGKNQELLERVFPGRFTEEEKDRISLDKEKQYQIDFLPNLQLIKGLDKELEKAKKAGIKMAIGTSAIRLNIDFVIDGLQIREYFDTIIGADDVKHSKPDPETYLRCAADLAMATKACLVFEDSPKGVESALNAGMDCIVITTLHQQNDFDSYSNIISFIKDYTSVELTAAIV